MLSYLVLALVVAAVPTPSPTGGPTWRTQPLPLTGIHTFRFSGNLSIDQSSGRVLIMVYSRGELEREAKQQVLLRPALPIAAQVDSVWSAKLGQPVNVMTLSFYNDIDCPGTVRIGQGQRVSIVRHGTTFGSVAGLDRPVQVKPGHVGIAFAVFLNFGDFQEDDIVRLEFPP